MLSEKNIKKYDLKELIEDFFKNYNSPELHIILIGGCIGSGKTSTATFIGKHSKEILRDKIKLINNLQIIGNVYGQVFYTILDDRPAPHPWESRKIHKALPREIIRTLKVLLNNSNNTIYISIIAQDFRSLFDIDVIRENVRVIILKSYINYARYLIHDNKLRNYLYETEELVFNKPELRNQGVAIEFNKILKGPNRPEFLIKNAKAFQISRE